MARGICVNCGKQVGGFLQTAGYFCATQSCSNHGKCYCFNCLPKTGLMNRAVCSQCGRLMKL